MILGSFGNLLNSSTEDNAKLLWQLKSGFKRTINSSKYQSNVRSHVELFTT